MRADGEAMRLVAQALHEIERRIAWGSLNGSLPFDEEGLAPGVAVGAFGDRDERHAVDAKLGQDDLRAASNCPCPPSMRMRSGLSGTRPRRRRGSSPIAPSRCAQRVLLHEPREAPPQDFAHHAVIVAGRQLPLLMLNVR